MNKGFCFIAALYTQSLFVWFWFLYRTLRVSPQCAFFFRTTFWFRLVHFLYVSVDSHLAPRFSFSFSLIRTSSLSPSPCYVCTYVYCIFDSFHSFLFFSFGCFVHFFPFASFLSSAFLSSHIYSNFSVLIKVLSVSIFYLYMLYMYKTQASKHTF